MTKTQAAKQLLLSISLILSILSCKNDHSFEPNKTSTLSFGVSIIPDPDGRIIANDVPAMVRVSVVDAESNLIHAEELLELFSFGDSYVSESIELNVGDYMLTLFQVLNDEGAVIMASPLEGSEKADEVKHPLPLAFTIQEDKLASVVPEVLLVGENDTPSQYGYVEFGFEVVNHFELKVGVLSDYDSTYVPSTILLRAYTKDSLLIEKETFNYQYGIEQIKHMEGSAHFFEVSIEQPDYHSINYYLKTEDLKALDVLKLRLSPTDFTNKYTVYQPEGAFQNDVHAYLPKDGCIEYVRFDITGVSTFYIHLSYSANDLETGLSLLPLNQVEYFSADLFNIVYPTDLPGNKAQNVCLIIDEEHGDGVAYDIEVFIMVDTGLLFDFYVFNWDPISQQWVKES